MVSESSFNLTTWSFLFNGFWILSYSSPPPLLALTLQGQFPWLPHAEPNDYSSTPPLSPFAILCTYNLTFSNTIDFPSTNMFTVQVGTRKLSPLPTFLLRLIKWTCHMRSWLITLRLHPYHPSPYFVHATSPFPTQSIFPQPTYLRCRWGQGSFLHYRLSYRDWLNGHVHRWGQWSLLHYQISYLGQIKWTCSWGSWGQGNLLHHQFPTRSRLNGHVHGVGGDSYNFLLGLNGHVHGTGEDF